MKNGFIKKALFAIALILIVISVIVVNRKITEQLHAIERGYQTAPDEGITAMPATTKQPPKRVSKPSSVRINPSNDPLAPRQKRSSAPARKPPQGTLPVVYEVPADTSVLAQ